ncbi:DUF4145 domain-containing protein [Gluconobacter kondonii]|uniref:DUF4145 domain-containing protein n=1 Tax=Gluconobacter kondonii TaxID=941463 RepID=UPI001B8CBC37|nr:DUF4145 domain-containing protein [Gluconobacter kondonii]MBS1054310.1 DUF4145 domain-containing protein [Gluconobacter kondonii]MBS1057938.1 DUF4145 domain-containing protein [Gluconobacter kondonii]
MKQVKNSLVSLEPTYISAWRAKNSDYWEAEFAIERWSVSMQCDETTCGEVIHMIGDIEVVEANVDLPDGGSIWGNEEMLRIQAVFPVPPLFRISENVPENVKKQLELAFRMYWTDVSACVARLRTAVERLLDDQGVPKQRLQKKGKNVGTMQRMDLYQRIESFTKGLAHKDQLQGLRNIGNLGTHGTEDVEDSDLFDAVDVLEFVLTGIYDTKTINAKAGKLKLKTVKT